MATKYEKDYQALIDKAVAAGNYAEAAEYEQLRNEKITNLGLDYATTNKYAGWLDKTDYGTIGKQQMASGADPKDVLKTYESRYNKSATTEGLTQYANDDLQKEMWAYITENMNKPGFDYDSFAASKPTTDGRIEEIVQNILNMDGFSYDVAAPVYNDTYTDVINSKITALQNRAPFSYNAEADPLYQQYKTQYQREGNRSMNDTLASVASGAGGMNSWAVTAAQQANDYYMAQLNDKIPELAQLAYSMYVQDFNDELAIINLLRGQSETDYNRFRDQYGDFLDERDYAHKLYLDDLEKMLTDLDILKDQDNTNYDRWRDDLDFAYGQYRDETEFDFKVDQDEYGKVMDLISSGTMPTPEQLKAAGLTEDQAASMLALAKAANNMDLYGNPNGYVPEGDDDGDNVGGNPGGDDNPSGGVGYDNGGLTEEKIMQMQAYFGVTPDGKWGPASQASVDGLSADEAWMRYEDEVLNNGGSSYDNGGLSPHLIKEMQKYFGVTADGKWGAQSQASVDGLSADEAWQRYEEETQREGEVANFHGDTWVYVDGIGHITYLELEEYVNSGKVKEIITSDGKHRYTKVK